MITCLAMPAYASNVEAEARALTAQTELTPAFYTGLEQFSADADTLSRSLREVGVAQDLPCIFHGISEDARQRGEALRTAATDAQRQEELTGLHALLDDAILIAPMAAGAAADIAAQQNIAVVAPAN
jgi:hypothetical protein